MCGTGSDGGCEVGGPGGGEVGFETPEHGDVVEEGGECGGAPGGGGGPVVGPGDLGV